MASQGRYVAPPPVRVDFPRFTPLTCRAGYGTMSAVDRMGGFRGLVIGLFRLPVRSAFIVLPFCGRAKQRAIADSRFAGFSTGYIFIYPVKTAKLGIKRAAGLTLYSFCRFAGQVRKSANR